jgi:hypothetical protein
MYKHEGCAIEEFSHHSDEKSKCNNLEKPKKKLKNENQVLNMHNF